MSKTRKKKIAFVLDTMIVGGVERAMLEMFRNIDMERYQVTLFLHDDQGPLHKMIPDNVRICYYEDPDTRQLLLSQLKHLRLIALAKGLYYRLQARRHSDEYDLNSYYCVRSMPFCSEEEFDCVIAYHSLSPIIVSTALYRVKGKKKALFVHGRNVRPDKLNPFYDKVFDQFHRIFCVSKQMVLEHQQDFPISGRKTCVMYNLLDVDSILAKSTASPAVPMRTGAVTLATVGRLVYVKGQDLIPHTARILLDKGYRFYWYVVGDGDYRATVEQEISKWGVQDHVIMLGTQVNPYPYVRNCDIYVQTSRSEGWCIATQEAKLLHKPIVTTGIPVMCEQFIDGENGIVTDTVTADSLAEGICLLLEDPQLRERLSHALANETVDNQTEMQVFYDFVESR